MCSAPNDAARLSDANTAGTKSADEFDQCTCNVNKPSQSADAFISSRSSRSWRSARNGNGASEQPRQAEEKSLPVLFE